MARFNTIDDMDLDGKVVLTRVDLNVPVENGRVTDATRIEKIVPTVKAIQKKGGIPVLLAHFARPKGKRVDEMSLRNVLLGLEVVGRVVAGEGFLGHRSILPFCGQGLGLLDVPALRGLVAAAQQDDEDRTALEIIHAIARPVVDPKLGEAVADRLGIAGMPHRQPVQARGNAGNGPSVAQA